VISVVVPTCRRRASVLRGLTALAAQDLRADEFEVVVSIDGSDDGTREAIGSFRAPYGLRVIDGPRRGRAAACNAGITVARGDVVVILDDDMEPAPACLSSHRRHHEDGARVCVMGAVPVRVDGDTPRVGRFVRWKFDLHLAKLAEPGHVFALRDFYSGNTSIRRDVLDEVGLFDESFTLYGNEDLELSLRLRAANVTLLYDRDALAHQHYEKDLAGLTRDTFEKGKTAVLLARSHPVAFDELQLASYAAHSRLWRALRTTLLRLRPSRLVLRAAEAAERTPIARRPLFYVLLLDYFYWLGVQSALSEGPTTGPLAKLAADLRHGPIRLLLHR
jgi:GT2 family glycosyltransferase